MLPSGPGVDRQLESQAGGRARRGEPIGARRTGRADTKGRASERTGTVSLQRVLHRSTPLTNQALRLVFVQLRLVPLRRPECPSDLVLGGEDADGEARERSRT